MADNNPTLTIINRARDGYRRAGVVFDKGTNKVSGAAFTADQLALLEADPHLDVRSRPAETSDKKEPAQGPVDGDGVAAIVSKKPTAKKKSSGKKK